MSNSDLIRHHFNSNDFYDILGLNRDCNRDEIRKAYLRLSLIYHPDKVADSSSEEDFKKKFQILSEIYQTLYNPESRERYDSKSKFSTVNLKDEDPVVYDTICLTQCHSDDTSYVYDCRCSGNFVLSKQLIKDLKREEQSFIVDCDSCSNCIRINL